MRSLGILCCLILAAACGLAGCSKDDDIVELEREVMAQQGQTDSHPAAVSDVPVLPAAASAPDSVRPELNAGAIPDEPPDEPLNETPVEAQDVAPETTPDQPLTPVDLPVPPAGDGFVVQLAGCEDPDYAAELVEKFRERGYEPFVSTETVGGETYHRVRLGVYPTYAEARQVQQEMSDKYSFDTWIDRIR